MVAGFIKLTLKPDKVEEAIGYWNSTLAAAKKEDLLLREKLHGHLLLVNRQTGRGYSIGFWTDIEASQAFQASELFSRLLGQLGSFCIKAPLREQFEIAGGSMEYVFLNELAA